MGFFVDCIRHRLFLFCLLPRTRFSLYNYSMSREESSDEKNDPDDIDPDDLVWTIDSCVLSPNGKEPLTVEQLKAIEKTPKGSRWASTYLAAHTELCMDDWEAECVALKRDPLNLAEKDVLHTTYGESINPTNGKPFTQQELLQVANTPNGKQWVNAYLERRGRLYNQLSDGETNEMSMFIGEMCYMPGVDGLLVENEETDVDQSRPNGISAADPVDGHDGDFLHMHDPSSDSSSYTASSANS